jgi:hypothetical protein
MNNFSLKISETDRASMSSILFFVAENLLEKNSPEKENLHINAREFVRTL